MAVCYVYSGAAGANNGTSWADAYTTLTTAIAGQNAGDTYYVASDHAESTAGAVTLSFKGSSTAPDQIISVNRAGSVPPVAADILAGGAVSTTGNSALAVGGSIYCYGITLNCGTTAVSPSLNLTNGGSVGQSFEACAFNIVASGSSGRITWGGSSGNAEKILATNCTVSFGAVGQGMTFLNSNIEIRSKPGSVFVTGATIPTTLIVQGAALGVGARLSGLDLSASGSGKTLVAAAADNLQPIQIINCKLDASVTVAATPSVTLGRAGVDVIGSSSAGTVERNERYQYQGTLTTETTIVRTAGASDGTTAYSWKVATTANAKRAFPFQCFSGTIWNSTTGASKTLTINTLTDNVTLTDAEIWVEVQYLGSSATPVSTLITDANATVLTTPANQPTSSSTWTTTGIGTPVKQELAVTFTPQMVGPIVWTVMVAKASTTVYVDPKPVIT